MHRFQRSLALFLIVAFLADTVVLQVLAQTPGEEGPGSNEWPRDVEAGQAEVVLYQPQPESFEGNHLKARAAVSVVPPGEKEPVFGAVWFDARVATDRSERTVELLDLKVPEVRFPDVPQDKQDRLKKILETEIPKWNLQISLDRLLASLETLEVRKNTAKDLKSDPPKILLVTEPTELVILEGKPELRPIDGSKALKVINTLYLLVLEPTTKAYFLNLGKIWMTASDLKGPWTQSENPPAAVAALTPKPDPELEAAEPDEGIVPAVRVVQEPMELVTCDGEPKYTPLDGNALLYVTNTDSSLLLEIGTQTYYLLASGRWFATKSLDGPWSYVAPDKLPESFAKIPPDSEVGDLRAFVAGTQEAEDAVMDAQIPQTAAIRRDDKSLTVTYDGEPQFKPIEKTELAYAVNTQSAVIRFVEGAKTTYYCCDNGVWYEAPTSKGSWTVAVKIPAAIYSIPPECPVYNVTYVRVYSYTPEVVYVGYTAGYTNCYVYGGTVVYGTGYHYTVWVGTVYYPRPVTYGWGYRYYPLSGGWFSPISLGGVVRRTRRRVRRRTYRRASHHHHHHHHHNRYNNHKGRVGGSRNQPARAGAASRTQPQQKRKNNHYADKNGNVHRRSDNGSWQQKNSSGWSNSNRSQSMERDHNSRQHGSSRTNSYQQSRPSSSSGSRGGRSSGGRGGGGRRR